MTKFSLTSLLVEKLACQLFNFNKEICQGKTYQKNLLVSTWLKKVCEYTGRRNFMNQNELCVVCGGTNFYVDYKLR